MTGTREIAERHENIHHHQKFNDEGDLKD